MNENIDDLFRLVQIYRPQGVGIEVSGQQGGFVQWIQEQMMIRNIFFPLSSDKNSGAPGIRPSTDKFTRFKTVEPWFKMGNMYFPVEMRDSMVLKEGMNELSLISKHGFKSKHDDFIDTISMLSLMNAWKPSEDVIVSKTTDDRLWDFDEDIDEGTDDLDSYIV